MTNKAWKISSVSLNIPFQIQGILNGIEKSQDDQLDSRINLKFSIQLKLCPLVK